jgi:hypothetical protein
MLSDLNRFPDEDRELPQVRVEPSTPLRAAKMTERSGSRVGGESEPKGFPGVTRATVGGVTYLQDLEPVLQGRRNMAVISNDDSTSHAMTLVVSYSERHAEEVVPADEVTSIEQFSRFERDHKAMIEFGAGTSSHTVLLDVVEGMTINVPGSYASAIIFDMTYSKFVASTVLTVYKTQASASAQAHPSLSQYTQRVFCPYQVSFDEENPPTIEDWKRQLLDAVCNRTIVTTT